MSAFHIVETSLLSHLLLILPKYQPTTPSVYLLPTPFVIGLQGLVTKYEVKSGICDQCEGLSWTSKFKVSTDPIHKVIDHGPQAEVSLPVCVVCMCVCVNSLG